MIWFSIILPPFRKKRGLPSNQRCGRFLGLTFQELYLIFYVTFYQISSFCRKILISEEPQFFFKIDKKWAFNSDLFCQGLFSGKIYRFLKGIKFVKNHLNERKKNCLKCSSKNKLHFFFYMISYLKPL